MCNASYSSDTTNSRTFTCLSHQLSYNFVLSDKGRGEQEGGCLRRICPTARPTTPRAAARRRATACKKLRQR